MEEIFDLSEMLKKLPGRSALVKWPGSFFWATVSHDMISDYISDNSPHNINHKGSCKERPYIYYLHYYQECDFIHYILGQYRFYKVDFMANEKLI